MLQDATVKTLDKFIKLSVLNDLYNASSIIQRHHGDRPQKFGKTRHLVIFSNVGIIAE
jgi:hypothetical protein